MSGAEFRIHATGIAGLEAVSAFSTHVFPKHSHDEYGIGIMVTGAQISASGRGQVTAEPGHVITVNPGEVHDGAPMGHGPRGWRMLYIAPQLMRRAVEDFGTGGDTEFTAPVIHAPQMRARLAGLHRLIRSGLDREDAAAVEEQLLGLLALAFAKGAGAGPAPVPQRLKALLAAIDAAPEETHDLASMAQVLALSRYQTIRAFARATGLTPHAYVAAQRTRMARRLMRGTDGLADIAARCGFTDQAHMTHAFRQRYGLTPAAYRRGAACCNLLQDRTR